MIPNPKILHVSDIYSDDFAFDPDVDAQTRHVPVWCLWQDEILVRLVRAATQTPFLWWLRWFSRMECHGLEHLPAKGPIILGANHRSHSDTALILGALPLSHRLRFCAAAAKDYWFKRRFKSTLVRFYFNALAVTRRGPGARTMVSELVRYLCRPGGRVLLIYPEGGRVAGQGIADFKSGVARISLISNTPIVPVAVQNSDLLLHRGASWISRPPKDKPCKVLFGPPIFPADYAEELKVNEVRAARNMTHTLRERLAQMLGEPLEPSRKERTRLMVKPGVGDGGTPPSSEAASANDNRNGTVSEPGPGEAGVAVTAVSPMPSCEPAPFVADKPAPQVAIATGDSQALGV